MSNVVSQAGKNVLLQRIVKSFGEGINAVDDIELDIGQGEFCTLLGPSGSGKTTTLKMIAGFEKPTRGRVFIGDRDVSRVPVANRNIGMVFQNYALFPHMTVEGNISFPLEMRKVPKSERRRLVRDVVKLVGLGGYEARAPRQLSGGQQQRVALARALVFNPDILLMDEPLGALDKNLRQSIQLELKKIHRSLGVTIVYVTHDQEEAMHLSDRVVVMNNGRIEQQGRPDELYNSPVNEFVANFLGECNLFTGEAKGGEANVIASPLLTEGIVLSREQARTVAEGTVTLGLRPERLYLGDAAAMTANRFSATVEDVIFVGTGHKVLLRQGKMGFTAVVPNRQGGLPVQRGELVQVGFNSGDGFLLSQA